jgi:hypothetical protein
MMNRDLVKESIVKTVKLFLILLFLLCVVLNKDAKADIAYGSSSIVYDTSNNVVRGYSRTQLDYAAAAYYTAYVCGSLSFNGVEQVRSCHSGFLSASVTTQHNGSPDEADVTSDHYVDMQYYDEENTSYTDYSGYSFLPGYSFPYDAYFYPPGPFTYHQEVSVRVGSTYVQAQRPIPKYFEALGTAEANMGCGANAAGYGVQVTYQVLDQDMNPMHVAGMSPQELVTVTDDAGHVISKDTRYRAFSGPTDSAGRFTDNPVGSCFGPPPSQNVCVNSTQVFNIVVTVSGSATTYDITTITIARDCVQGVKISTVSPDEEFTCGTVN